MKKVLILGGGFAGVEAAIMLRKASFEVTLVSDRSYFYLYPLSIWVPTREKKFQNVCIDLSALQKKHGFELIIDPVTEVNAKENRVSLESGAVLQEHDYLILAMGAHKMNPKGLEHTLSICGAPESALQLRDRLDALIELGSGTIAFGFGGNPKDTSAVRGGPAFELMFNVHNLLQKYGMRDSFELHFFAPMSEPGKRMGDKAFTMLQSMLKECRITPQVGKKITSFDEKGVLFEDGYHLAADLTMFIPAGSGHGVLQDAGLPLNEAGYVCIDDSCRVRFEEEDAPTNIYAIGDIAAIEGPEWRAKQGHVAEVMARTAAANIIAAERGEAQTQGYGEHLNILCIMDTGDGATVVYRDEKRAFMLPLPVIGHWLKKAWGIYFKQSKLGRFPRLPGM